MAEIALARLNDVVAKNTGLRLAAELESGRGIKEPAEMGYFVLVSNRLTFMSNRLNTLSETIDEMMLIREKLSI